jgi:hypothetical protein
MVQLHDELAAGADPATALHVVRRAAADDPSAAATAAAFVALGRWALDPDHRDQESGRGSAAGGGIPIRYVRIPCSQAVPGAPSQETLPGAAARRPQQPAPGS